MNCGGKHDMLLLRRMRHCRVSYGNFAFRLFTLIQQDFNMHDEDKLRRLSRYEARDETLFVLRESTEMEFLSPFGPLIGRTRMPEYLVEHVNEHVDGLFSEGQGGTCLLSEEFSRSGGDDSLMHWISVQVARYVQGVEQEVLSQLTLERFWVVSQYSGTPSPMHFHSGDVSGVMYLKVPDVDEEHEQGNYIAGRQAGYINFMSGGKQRLSRSLISFKPVVGELLIFPAWLLHGAEPFIGTGERRSVAFNAAIGD